MTGLDATIARALSGYDAGDVLSFVTTPGQDAQACATCDADPHAAPGRYCASLACRCGHPACPAAASWVPREGQARVIHLLEPRTT